MTKGCSWWPSCGMQINSFANGKNMKEFIEQEL